MLKTGCKKRVNSKHRKIHHMAKSCWTLSLVCVSSFSVVRLRAVFHLLEEETWSTYITYCCSFRDKHKGEGFARMSVYSYPTFFWSIPDYNTIYWSEKIIFLPVCFLLELCVVELSGDGFRQPKNTTDKKRYWVAS